MAREFTTQFLRMGPAQWLRDWETHTDNNNEVRIVNHGHFLSLDRDKKLVISDGCEVKARMPLTPRQVYKMEQNEHYAMTEQLAICEREAMNINYPES